MQVNKSSPRGERPPASGAKIWKRTKINLDLRCGDWVAARVHDDAARHDFYCVRSKAVRKSRASKKSPSRIYHQHLERNFEGARISMQGAGVTRVHHV